jgi:hypothetical protein
VSTLELSFCTLGCYQLIFSQSDVLGQLDFRQLLAEELMDVSFIVNAGNKKMLRRSMEPAAGVETAPVYQVGLERKDSSSLQANTRSTFARQWAAKKQIRTYCKCMTGFWMCPACICMHIAQIAEAL